MLTRFLGGTAACVGAAGMLQAQTPIAPPDVFAAPRPVVQVVGDVHPAPIQTLPSTVVATQPVAPQPVTVKPPVTAAPAKPVTVQPAPAAVVATPNSQLLANAGCSPMAAPLPTACPTNCPTACCTPCGPPGRFWVDAGYIYWTTRGQNLPPLITSAPPGTARNVAGTLGGPGTQILSPRTANKDWRSGFYLNAGMWFDECQKCGIEGNFFFLENSNTRSVASCPPGTTDIITRPFFNTQTGAQDTQLVCFPNVLSGSVDVKATNRVIGGGGNFIKNLCCGPCGRLDLLLGYSYLNVNDSVTITENLLSGPGQTNVANGTRFLVQDRFGANNNFNGVNVGLSGEKRWSHFFVGVRGGVALGVNNQSVTVDGRTVITPPGGAQSTFSGGLLAQPSNIGRYSRDTFAVMPWVGARVGVQLTERVRTYVGYDFFALTNTVRAGDQIDLRVNPTQIPPRANGVSGPLFPAPPTLKDTTFWGQGVRFGVEVRF